MKKYEIEFKHTVEITYVAIIKAENKEQAEEIFDDDPFNFVDNLNGEDEQGLDIEIIEIKEIKE